MATATAAAAEQSAVPSAALPPTMLDFKRQTADAILASLNRTPLFMTSLDDGDGQGGANVELEALRALAHEGTRTEVAAGFREQGNELARLRRWADARSCYDQALAALKATPTAAHQADDGGEENDEGSEASDADGDVVMHAADAAEDEEATARRLAEACHLNRALCNLELRQ